ncbi:MAG TPA: Asp-tRNA(Asn)/Glu-tRNA(Gln) amidotransferase GatCAB subunit C [Methanomassiliicoccales archaeon]|nr:Asp-tRNA(Asn)/Glu-tRNA(Gln) amidotransferase GatCAB subunit C [Methanomassiliicoccales archaeon]
MDLEVVRKVARIARLELSEDELEEFSRDLEEILEYLSGLDKAPSCEEYGFNPVPIEDVMREDEPCIDIDPSLLRELLDTYQDWVRGPRLA